MHFRDRGASIQVIRSAYSPETKRSKNEVVGRIPRSTLEIPGELKDRLSTDEIAEVAAYIERSRALDLLRGKVAAHGLCQSVDQALDYARGVTDPAERDQLRAVFAEAVLRLRQALSAGEPNIGRGRQARLEPTPRVERITTHV